MIWGFSFLKFCVILEKVLNNFYMMMTRTIILLIIFTSSVYSQYNGYDFGISSSLVYTTSADIYLNPNSADPSIRNRSFPISDIINPSVELRYRLSEPLIIGVGTEYMTSKQIGRNLIVYEGNHELSLETEDGFTFVPIELSLYYQMPFSTQSFKFLMGGGAGFYLGEFSRTFGDTEISTLEKQTAFGLHGLFLWNIWLLID